MTIAPTVGMTLTCVMHGNGALIDQPHLILHIDTKANKIVLIPVEVSVSRTGNHYFKRYHLYPYSAVVKQLNSQPSLLTQRGFTSRSVVESRREEIDEFYAHEETHHASIVEWEVLRWKLIGPIIQENKASILFNPQKLRSTLDSYAKNYAEESTYLRIFSESGRLKVDGNGKPVIPPYEVRCRRVRSELDRLINQFWACGGHPEGLRPFTNQCGGRGKRRKAGSAKRGRPNALTRAGYVGKEGVNITEDSEHAQCIEHCYHTYYVRGVTVAAACRRMWTLHYSEDVQQSDGTIKTELVPQHERPTIDEFRRHGKLKDRNQLAYARHFPPNYFEKNCRAVLKAAHSITTGVGQLVGIDSTSPKMQFVSPLNRLKRVGGATRIMLFDPLTHYIPGFYMGYWATSDITVRLSAYNSMMGISQVYLDAIGLSDLDAKYFIKYPIGSLIGDNTDLRNRVSMSVLSNVHISMNFTPINRADLNPVESGGHHVIHRLSDYRLLGSCFGDKSTPRGEESAVLRARHTLIEGIRETLRAVFVHNTTEIKTPLPLYLRELDVTPTPYDLTRELIRQGRFAASTVSEDALRRRLLPLWDGTFTENGVRLHRPDTGDAVVFIERIRYVNDDNPLIVSLCTEARRRGHKHDSLRRQFLVNPLDLQRIWFAPNPTSHLIELKLRDVGMKDPDLPFEATLADVVTASILDEPQNAILSDQSQRRLAAMEDAQESTRKTADREYNEDLARAGGKITKSQQKAGRAVNRAHDLVETLVGAPLVLPQPVASSEAGPNAGKSSDQVQRVPMPGSKLPVEKSLIRAALDDMKSKQ